MKHLTRGLEDPAGDGSPSESETTVCVHDISAPVFVQLKSDEAKGWISVIYTSLFFLSLFFEISKCNFNRYLGWGVELRS